MADQTKEIIGTACMLITEQQDAEIARLRAELDAANAKTTALAVLDDRKIASRAIDEMRHQVEYMRDAVLDIFYALNPKASRKPNRDAMKAAAVVRGQTAYFNEALRAADERAEKAGRERDEARGLLLAQAEGSILFAWTDDADGKNYRSDVPYFAAQVAVPIRDFFRALREWAAVEAVRTRLAEVQRERDEWRAMHASLVGVCVSGPMAEVESLRTRNAVVEALLPTDDEYEDLRDALDWGDDTFPANQWLARIKAARKSKEGPLG